jgi:predicted PurR-regulated permease PerM
VGWQSRDALRVTALVAGLYIVLRLGWFASPLVLTAFLGILFGLALSSGVDQLQRFRIPRGIGAAFIVLTFVGALTGFGAWVAPTLREQGSELRLKLPQAIDRAESWLDQRHGLAGMLLGTRSRADSVALDSARRTVVPSRTLGDTMGPGGPPGDSAVAAAQRPDTSGTAGGLPPTVADSAGPSLSGRLAEQFSGMSRYLFPFLSSTVAVFAGILLVIFMAIYIAADPKMYRGGLMHLFVPRHRERAGEVLSAIASVLRRWLVTQLIAMVTIGVVTTIVLSVLNVKAAVALGVIAGLLEFVPTVGPILSAVPAVAMGFLDSPEKALTVAIAYVAIQFVENHLLIPLLMKGGVNVPPVLTILSQALMAILFGFLGLMCAVPLLAAVMVMVKMLYVEDVLGEPAFGPDENPSPDAE